MQSLYKTKHILQTGEKGMATYNSEVMWHTGENGMWAYRAGMQKIDEYATWFKEVRWSLFATLTFPWRPDDFQANAIFTEFMGELEWRVKADVGYLRGDEERISGCGKPPVGRHYHA